MTKSIQILVLFIVFSSYAFAETYYVSPAGANGSTGTESDPLFLIQEAVDNCISGSDTIYLVEGSYWQHFLISEKDGIYISSIDPLNISTLSGSGVEGLHQIEISNSDNIYIDNLILREHFVQDAIAIYANGSGNNLAITDCEFFNIGWGSDPDADPESFSPVRQAHAILINGRTEAGIQNVYIGRNHFHDIIVGNSEVVTLTGNTVDFLIEDNTIEDATNIGIVVAGHYSWAFPEELNAELNQARNGRIRRNEIRNCRRPTPGNDPAAIYVDGGANVIIDRNEVYNNGTGISVGCENTGTVASDITIADNVVYNNDKFGSSFGANAGNIENCTMRNNTFFNNGIFFDNSGSISIQKCTDSSIRDNIVFLTSEDYYGISAFGYLAENLVVLSNQLFSSAGETDRVIAISPADGSSISVANLPFQDPLLSSTDTENPDFNLLEGSPCINQGNPFFIDLPEEFDFYGNPRVVQLVDIGAAESDLTNSTSENESAVFNLFPNPTSGISTVESNSAIHFIRVLDLSGKVVKALSGNGGMSQAVDLGGLESGIYLLKISNEDQISTRKIVIQ